MKSRVIVLLAVLVPAITACAAITTKFRGVQSVSQTYEKDKSTTYKALMAYFAANDFVILGGSKNLGVIRAKYTFPGTGTWGGASSVMKEYAESIAPLAINRYGKNSFVKVNARITEPQHGKSEVTLRAHFQTWGEPGGMGGVGPFFLNSKMTWERELLDGIAEYLPDVSIEAKQATGTCFAVNPEGVVVTAYHVVEGAESFRVHLGDGTVTEAKLQTFSAQNDLAILSVKSPTPHFLPLARSGSVQAGDHVFTMGYPAPGVLGQEPKFTEGSVSALSGFQGEAALLQMSVPIQPGNSGGPLVNERGEVVGVVTSTAAVQAFFAVTGSLPQNINWAVKADYLRPLLNLPSVKSVSVNRRKAIDKVRQAICMVEASSR